MRLFSLIIMLLALLVADVKSAFASSFAEAIKLAKAGQSAEAIVLFESLSRDGHPLAQLNLAVLQAMGQGIPKNDLSAAYWAWRARFSGEVRAVDLSEYLVTNLPDQARARLVSRLDEDLLALAETGHTHAFLSLGRVALELHYPSQNIRALEWFSLAAAFEVPNAALLRDAVALEVEPAARLVTQAKTLEAFDAWCIKLPSDARLPTC